MKQVFVRFADQKDAPQFEQWVTAAQAINLWDPAIMDYPTTRTLVAHNGEPLMYMPVQTALMMESLAPKPGISPIEEGLALREITKAVALLASQQQIRESYFLCKDERVVKFASAHGYELLPWKTLRMRLK
jgi:hypothetical protein